MAKSKLTPEVHDKIINLIKAGNYISTACQVVGINVGTYYYWLKKGMENKSKKYAKFYGDVKKAEAINEAYYLKFIQKAALKNWQAAAWFLERKYPAKYGKKVIYAAVEEMPQMKKAEVVVEQQEDQLAGVLKILIESGGFDNKLIENNTPESTDERVFDAETE